MVQIADANELTGSVPREFGALTELNTLYLSKSIKSIKTSSHLKSSSAVSLQMSFMMFFHLIVHTRLKPTIVLPSSFILPFSLHQ